MSAKNRAFALAVGTAALVALSAPIASAATFHGPNQGPGSWSSNNSVPNGFNNDSILNVSGNQVSSQACTTGAQANANTIAQTITAVTGTISSPSASAGADTASQTAGCAQGSTPAASGDNSPSWSGHDNNNSGGFNNDSILKVAGNKVPTQVCTFAAQGATNTVAQTVAAALGAGIVSPALTTGAFAPVQNALCSQS